MAQARTHTAPAVCRARACWRESGARGGAAARRWRVRLASPHALVRPRGSVRTLQAGGSGPAAPARDGAVLHACTAGWMRTRACTRGGGFDVCSITRDVVSCACDGALTPPLGRYPSQSRARQYTRLPPDGALPQKCSTAALMARPVCNRATWCAVNGGAGRVGNRRGLPGAPPPPPLPARRRTGRDGRVSAAARRRRREAPSF